jgi:hypothetical protein
MTAKLKKNPSNIITGRGRFQTAVTQAGVKQFHSLLGLAAARMLTRGGTYVILGHGHQ